MHGQDTMTTMTSLVLLLLLSILQPSSAVCPSVCQCNGEETEVQCVDQVLFDVPAIPKSVKHLNLSKILLGPDLTTPLSSLRHLTHLDLSSNMIVRISNSTFHRLHNLTHLNLSNNRLRSLHDDIFEDNPLLEVLDLSGNALTSLDEVFYRHLTNLKELYLSRNNFFQLKLGLRFQVLDQLQVLDLSYNDFGDVENDAFEYLDHWSSNVNRSLSLAHCQISTIQNGTFLLFGGLYNLNLSGITTMDQGNLTLIMNDLQHVNTKVLDMSFMNLGNVDTVFASASKLSFLQLNLTNNNLEKIDMNAFQNIGTLHFLDVSHNNIKLLPPSFRSFGKMRYLDLSHNKLRALNGPSIGRWVNLEHLKATHNLFDDRNLLQFDDLLKLRILDLSYNTLDSLITTGDNAKLEELILKGNNISSLDMIPDAGSLRILDVSENKLTTLGPYLFSSSLNIETVDFSQNEISVIDNLAFLPNSSIAYDINLSGNQITRLEYGGWSSAHILNISSNRISQVDFHSFQGMYNLQTLDLSNNYIQELDDELFTYLHKLETLKLDHNKLTSQNTFMDLKKTFRPVNSLRNLDLSFNEISHLDKNVFINNKVIENLSLANNKFSTILPGVLKKLKNLMTLDISSNPFSCNCDLLPLVDWLERIDPVVFGRSVHAYTCVGPGDRIGMQIFDFKPPFLECDNDLLELIVFGSLGALTIIVGIVGTIVCRLYHKWSEKIMLKKEEKRAKKSKPKNTFMMDDIPFEVFNELDHKLKMKLLAAKQNGYRPIANGEPMYHKDYKKPNKKTEKEKKKEKESRSSSKSRSRSRSKSKDDKTSRSRSRSKSKDRSHKKDQEKAERRQKERLRRFEKELRYTLARYNPTSRWDADGRDRWATMEGSRREYNPEKADRFHTMPYYRHPRQTLLDDQELKKSEYSHVQKSRHGPKDDRRREHARGHQYHRLSPTQRYDIVRVARRDDRDRHERVPTHHEHWPAQRGKYNMDAQIQYLRDRQRAEVQWTNTVPRAGREKPDYRKYPPFTDSKHQTLPERRYVELPFPDRERQHSLDMYNRRDRPHELEERRERQIKFEFEGRRSRSIPNDMEGRSQHIHSDRGIPHQRGYFPDHVERKQHFYDEGMRNRPLLTDIEDRRGRQPSYHDAAQGRRLSLDNEVRTRGYLSDIEDRRGRELSSDTEARKGRELSSDDARRGRELSSDDARRGRELSSDDARRGRELSSDDARRGREFLSDIEARRGRELSSDIEDGRGRQYQSQHEMKSRDNYIDAGYRPSSSSEDERRRLIPSKMEDNEREVSQEPMDPRSRHLAVDNQPQRIRSYGPIDFKAKKRKFEEGLEANGKIMKDPQRMDTQEDVSDRKDILDKGNLNEVKAEVHREEGTKTPEPDYPADNDKPSDWV